MVLVKADQTWALLAINFGAASFGKWAEDCTAWGQRVTACVISMLITFTLCNVGVIPSSAPAYDVIFSYLVPTAIPLLLFKANIVRVVKEAGKPLVIFFISIAATAIGGVLGYLIFPETSDFVWRAIAVFVATYTGGTLNFVAASEVVELHGSERAAAVAADSLICMLYLLTIFSIPSAKWVCRRFAVSRFPMRVKMGSQPACCAETDLAVPENTTLLGAEPAAKAKLQMGEATRQLISLAIATTVCAVSYAVADGLKVPTLFLLFVTVMIVAVASLWPSFLGSTLTPSATPLGSVLMNVFFAAIGSQASVAAVLATGPFLFGLAAFIIVVHLVLVGLLGKVLKWELAEMLIASNACVGGPPSVAAMTAAFDWDSLTVPGVLCGTFGYALGTFVGVGVGFFCRDVIKK